MNEHTAVVIGASGLVGNFLLHELLNDSYFKTVRILVRKPLPILHKNLQQEIVDFDNLPDLENKMGSGDIIFSCIGTTQKNVKGDNSLYENIDHDIPVNAAAIGISKGFKKFLMVSSVGADSNSSNFYLRLKGKTEDDIKQFDYENISFFRPSMLLGKRSELRPFEPVLQNGIKFISLFLFGSLKKYHSIQASDVAKAMIAESKKSKKGIAILHYKEMQELLLNHNL